ncbi:septin and tuftelin-interacting protein 1 homolog 1-like [Coffea arabica]|uniref:Septin and tuftelin-interacting protein 1 homolog 1-like n=1 Tax=Coffea arabica TaxID=13443 RepID=A0ABM4V3A7_COFAR
MPKLLTVMHEFQIHAANQKLDQFYWVWTWVTAIPIHHMIHIMDIFFNKWQEVLYHWLCSSANFEEVRKWYSGWKDLLPPELLANQHIFHRLNVGLDMMNQAVDGMEVVQPGLRENISYPKVCEQTQFEKAAAQAQERASQLQGSSGLEMSLKEVIEVHAQQNCLLFKPKAGRMQDGYQIYGFGNINVVIDSLNRKVFAQIDDRWSLASLEQLLELHNRSGIKQH